MVLLCASAWFFVVAAVVLFLVIIIGFYSRLKRCLKSHPLLFLLCFEGNRYAQHTSGRPPSFPYHFMLHYNRSCMTPKDAFDFKVLVIYLCNTHVKLEIHLSLPDNNVQNGASCMNHYLRPGVVLIMNMHEPIEGGREICTTCFVEELQMVRLTVLSLGFQSQAQRLPHHPQLLQSSQNTCFLLTASAL